MHCVFAKSINFINLISKQYFRPLNVIGLNTKMDLGYYPNALWCIIVTIYTGKMIKNK